jgi:nicotinate-nucleotide adenylyltransferase
VKLGILGGSFNPVHLGHLYLADIAISSLNLDRVVFVPAFRSPFKLDAHEMESSVDDRLEMLAASIAGDPRLAIDNCEIKREGISYTVDTLEDIIARYMPEGKPVLIIGDDLAEDFLKWHDSERILQLAEIVVARRMDSARLKLPYRYVCIDNDIINISSQKIRHNIKKGNEWRSLVPAGARVIIEDRRLYGCNYDIVTKEDCSNTVIMKVESAVREALTPERFLHSRNTALLAYDMCRRYGVDPKAGYLAGIAHDFAKQIDNKLMLKLAKSDGMEIPDLFKDRPNLLHGRAAAVLLKERFSIHNKDVLEAVAVHTSGSEHMGSLAKIIYIADKAEVSRNIDTELKRMCYEDNRHCKVDLDSILYVVLKKTVSKLQSRELNLSVDTLRLLERMKERHH